MTGLLSALIGMVAALGIDIMASRGGASRLTIYAASFCAGACAASGCALLAATEARASTLAIAACAYACWWFIFLNLVQALASSLRVRLLYEVRSAGGRITRAKLKARYNDDILLRLRLRRLRDHGSVVERSGCLFLDSIGLRLLAGFFRLLKKILVGHVSEFEGPSA